MMLASIAAALNSAVVNYALMGLVGLGLAVATIKSVRKTGLGLMFLMFVVGVMEIHFEVVNSFPIAWGVGIAGFVLYLLVQFVGAVIKQFKWVSEFDHKSFKTGNAFTDEWFENPDEFMRKRRPSKGETVESTDSGSDDEIHPSWSSMGRNGANGRGGLNDFYDKDDPMGIFY